MRHAFVQAALVIGALFALSSVALAQPASRDLRLATAESERRTPVAEIETVLGEVLEGAGEGHIVGRAGVLEVLSTDGLRVASCLRGLDACTSVEAALVEGLGASRVIYAHVRDRGDAVDLRVVEVATNRSQQLSVTGDGLRDTLYEAVAALTGLTSGLRVESAPDGARVYLDETLIGITPFQTTVGIGAYRLRMERDGYAVYASNIEVRPGGAHRRCGADTPLRRGDGLDRGARRGAARGQRPTRSRGQRARGDRARGAHAARERARPHHARPRCEPASWRGADDQRGAPDDGRGHRSTAQGGDRGDACRP